jgi:diguanylate cyclase (GGDEF)-like protein
MTSMPMPLPATSAPLGTDPQITEDRSSGGRWAWPAMVALTASAAVLAAMFPTRPTGRWVTVSLGVAAALATAVAAVPLARSRTIQTERRRIGLLAIATGILLLSAQEMLRALPDHRLPAYPLATDWLGLAAYPVLMLGLLLIMWMHVQERPLDSLLVAGMVPAALGFLAWAVVTDGVSVSSPSLAGHTLAALAFVLLDGMLVAIAVRLVVLTRGDSSAYWYLMVGLCCLLAAHLARAVATAADDDAVRVTVRAMLALGLGLIGGAAVHPSATRWLHRPPAPIAPGLGRVWLLGWCVVLAPLVDAWHLLRGGRPRVGLVVVSAVFAVAVVVHLGRTIRDLVDAQRGRRHDELTGLPGRALFHDVLRTRLNGLRRDGSRIGVLVLDIDRFKKVNDSLGQAAGDELLAAVTQRLQASLLRPLTMARLGGDEFAIMLPGADRRVTAAVAQEVLQAFSERFMVAGHRVVVTASIGAAVAPEHGTDAELLLQRADTAMYAAKAAHGNTFRTYETEMQDRASRRLELESGLHVAIEQEQLRVHYQPKVDVRTGRIVGAEALVRWEHPTRGIVPPLDFIELAEETGLIAPLGEWVLRRVCGDLRDWQRAGIPVVPVAVNVSARQFELTDVAELVATILDETEVSPELLELELTESLAVQGAEWAITVLGDLQLIGVRCSIDDFGTGYSALTYLSRFPVQQIKVDKSFVSRLGQTGSDAAAIIRAVVAMGRGLGLEVVAEGVETDEQLAFLTELGCDVMQGYLFSRPVPEDAFTAMLEDGDVLAVDHPAARAG